MDEQERYEFGLKTRKSVLGEAHVERALAGRTEFNTEFQDLITRYAWGEIWTRPAIDHPTRRLLTLAMMIALNRGEEFKMHVRAAVQHGVSRDLIKEVILQSAIYCGVPAANTAFHQAAEVFAALDGTAA
ncbi:4-carboxymuconolactone decarboxylase [Nitrospirillum sp. BR 11828]|uniref:4-carboxymuconolactone decarboxylase n=1 Tax=Nitrospirillum sp. BR 11828 TaxID=3104325 RepID=UPI002ACA0D1D|nr:4-carboxymuconolactone decarboxylase [Nitrospirillum sp. BR 11828]MDZ5650305.1 4-carboxymuconolactone decarboxylase [Nitrospirillum sp. BR 11828]